VDILIIKFNGWENVVLSFNWVAAIILLLLIVLLSQAIKYIHKKHSFKTIQIDEATIGIGSSSITIKYDGRIKEIAYKIWIELTTRKIGIRFEESYDVISEVYDSWYEAFSVIRMLLESIPADRINDAKGLIELTTKVLNSGLRPHLTMWQAKYRSWYSKALDKNDTLPPQEVQKKFPEYQPLINDLRKTNSIMIKYAEELKRLIDKT
jgi:hypothetical protein